MDVAAFTMIKNTVCKACDGFMPTWTALAAAVKGAATVAIVDQCVAAATLDANRVGCFKSDLAAGVPTTYLGSSKPGTRQCFCYQAEGQRPVTCRSSSSRQGASPLWMTCWSGSSSKACQESSSPRRSRTFRLAIVSRSVQSC